MTVLDPNGAIPPFRRRPAAQDFSTANGHAAGVLFVAPDGDVLLMHRASSESNYGGHWGLPGGKAEAGESPEAAARREAGEELGGSMDGRPMKVIDQRVTPTGVAFHTYAHAVEKKFQPQINDEHAGYTWASLDALPQPLHPGVAATLAERLQDGRQAADMTPEDWTGLREGLLKWLAEEEAEPEHGDSLASDQMPLALDKDSVRSTRMDGQLEIAVANISKAAVNPYLGREIPDWQALGLDPNKTYNLLRDPDELKKGAATFNGVPLLIRHVAVSAEDHKPWDVVGTTGTDAKFDDPFLTNSLFIWTQGAINVIDSGAQKELSCGYHYKPDMTAGNFRGTPFDGVMRGIVANHVALVKDGRAGPDVVVGDSSEELMSENRDLAKMINAIANRAVSVQALTTYLKPRLALDAKTPVMAAIFKDIPGAKFKDMKPEIAKRVRALALDGKHKLAKDATLDDVEKVLGMLEEHEVEGGDESVSEAQHNAMESAAHGSSTLGIPEKVGKEFADADKGKSFDAEPMKAWLREKGMGEDDIAHLTGMLPKNAAQDEDPEEKKKREEAEAKKAAEDKARDESMKDMVTKGAMDEAIKAAVGAAVQGERSNSKATMAALQKVRPVVGELALAFDTAAEVYRHVLKAKGIANADAIHESALETMVDLLPKAGARPVEMSTSTLGMDAAATESFNTRFPGADRIGVA